MQKALIHLNNPVKLEQSHFELNNQIINVLAPVTSSVEAFCDSDANLCTAIATYKFFFQQLIENDSILVCLDRH